MAEKADDLYLPNAVLLRIIRDSLPERTIVSREARSAISKSASSFILYVTSLASVHCEKSKRKTLTGNDILAALKEMEFGHFTPALNAFLEKYREQTTARKTHKRLHSEIDEGKTSNQLIKNLPSSSSSTLVASSSSSSTMIPNSKLLSDNNVVSSSEIEEENMDENDPNDEDVTDEEVEVVEVEDEEEEDVVEVDEVYADVGEGEEEAVEVDEVEPDEDIHFSEENVGHDQAVIVIPDDDNSSQKTEALKENDDSV